MTGNKTVTPAQEKDIKKSFKPGTSRKFNFHSLNGEIYKEVARTKGISTKSALKFKRYVVMVNPIKQIILSANNSILWLFIHVADSSLILSIFINLMAL
jgi:hypothetical protein